MGISKTGHYESPYTVKGSIKQAGTEELPKSIYVRIGLSERRKLKTWIPLSVNEVFTRKISEEI